MPMIPMGPEDEMMMEDGPMPAAPGPMGGDPMMDGPEPAPEELALLIGSQIAAKRDAIVQAADMAASEELQVVMQTIAQAAQGAQVMGPGQLA